MTRPRTWREGARFFKDVAGPREAERLIACAQAIRRAGVDTPEPRYCSQRSALAFPAIDGVSGVALIGQARLRELLAPLITLSRADASGLARHDPLAKIRPRLGNDAPRWLIDRIARLEDVDLDPLTVVHGDFHCGQLILDGSGRVWVIDLEDMARGPVEVDLGNFAAHLATRPETRRKDLSDGARIWTERVAEAWCSLGQQCDPAVLWRHVDIALTRRALKLRERGEPNVLAALERLSPLL